MSHARFEDRAGAIELTGAEVANIGYLAETALAEALGSERAEPVRRAIGWTRGDSRRSFLRRARPATGVMVGEAGPFDLFNLGCATLVQAHPCAIGLVRLFRGGLGWIEGSERGWLADCYQQCLDAGLARAMAGDRHLGPIELRPGLVLPPGKDAGWEELIAWLCEGDGPVVTTLSVNEEAFPDRRLAAEAGVWSPAPGTEAEQDAAWDALTGEQQWQLGIAALRRLEPVRPRRWTPEAFARPSLTVDHLVEYADQVRLATAARR